MCTNRYHETMAIQFHKMKRETQRTWEKESLRSWHEHIWVERECPCDWQLVREYSQLARVKTSSSHTGRPVGRTQVQQSLSGMSPNVVIASLWIKGSSAALPLYRASCNITTIYARKCLLCLSISWPRKWKRLVTLAAHIDFSDLKLDSWSIDYGSQSTSPCLDHLSFSFQLYSSLSPSLFSSLPPSVRLYPWDDFSSRFCYLWKTSKCELWVLCEDLWLLPRPPKMIEGKRHLY